MTHQPLTKAEREELQAFAADRMNVSVYSGELIEKALADLVAAEADASELRNILLCHNFAPCDTAACNCNGWHERATGNGFYARFREIEEAVGDHNGKTLLKAVQEIVAQRDRAESELAAERRMRVEADAASDRLMAERDALIRNINDAFLSLNIPNSTMAFDGRNLLPHAVESARYAEEMRIERDKALADVAKYVDRSESFASAIDHLVSNTADGTDLARITKERDDFRDGMVAMLVAAGAPVDLDAMEAAVLSAGKKPSDFISQRIRVLTAERDALWVDHRDVVDERDALKAQRDSLHARLYPQPCKGCPGCSSYADCPDEIDRMTTERDALKARLAALVEACDAKDDMLACCRLSLDSLYADLRQERGE